MKLTFSSARQLRNDPLLRYLSEVNYPLLDEGFIGKKRIHVGFAGDFKAVPILSQLRENATFVNYIESLHEDSLLFVCGKDNISLFAHSLPKYIKEIIHSSFESLANYGGILLDDGSLQYDLKSLAVGSHYAINLLLGNRENSLDSLLSTPKSVVDAFGRGSFRGPSDYQILASRWDILPEENGNPFNRQFYLVDKGKIIFYSGEITSNVVSSFVTHGVNETRITYELKDGLKIERIIFLSSQLKGCPEAIEIQEVNLLSKTNRDLEICFTGMFGFSNPSCAENDVIYQTVIQESSILENENKEIVSISPHYYPVYFKDKMRFFGFKSEEGFATSFTSDAISFLNGGTISSPRGINSLNKSLAKKGASFFALKKEIHLIRNEEKHLFSYTGMVKIEKDEGDLREKITNFLSNYGDYKKIEEIRKNREEEFKNYSSSFSVSSTKPHFDSLLNRNLPFQNLYQTFVSRSFSLTQKGYREIGFREIQDLYASIPYFVAEHKETLAKKLLIEWVKNVYPFGYANHNFYYVGKEPGYSSDDALWLLLATMEYIELTDDHEILDEVFLTADHKNSRSLRKTLRSIVNYSGTISVGKHGLPLLDLADWNDCLKIDGESALTGPEKEALYQKQIQEGLIKEGGALSNEGSESVMNAFLLIAGLNKILLHQTLFSKEEIRFYQETKNNLENNVKKFAWIEGYFARVLINKKDSKYSYVGSLKDELSDNTLLKNGSIYLNSFSWSVLANVAREEEIKAMISLIDKHLKTKVGYKLCSKGDLTLLGTKDSATSHYFPGDRENGGVFKHAAMMFVESLFLAAKRVKDESLKETLLDDAYFMLEVAFPYYTLNAPYLYKGNPRFCTQYANPYSLESVGPILSGTATWMLISLKESLGISFLNPKEEVCPLLPKNSEEISYRYKVKNGEFLVHVHKNKGTYAKGIRNITFDGTKVEKVNFDPLSEGKHIVEILMK